MTRARAGVWLLLSIALVAALGGWHLFSSLPSADGAQVVVGAVVVKDEYDPASLYRIEADAGRDGWTADRALAAARLWTRLGSPATAAVYLERADDSLAVRRALAETYLVLGEWARAQAVLTPLERTDDDGTAAWAALQLGLLLSASQPDDARLYLERASVDTGYARAVSPLLAVLAVTSNPTRIALVLAQIEQWALVEYALDNAADDPIALALTALARTVQGKDGVAHLRTALLWAPDDPQVRLLAGLVYREREQYDASLSALIMATALDPDDPLLYAELGTAYQLHGDLVTAERWLQYAVALSGGDARFVDRVEALRGYEQTLSAALEAMIAGERLSPSVTTQPSP